MLTLKIALLAALMAAAPEARSDANLAFQRGRAAFKAGAFEQAIGEFSSAFQLFPSLKVLYNLGLAYDGAGRKRDALDAWRKVDRELETASPEDRETLAERIDAVRARCLELQQELTLHEGREAASAAAAPTPLPPAAQNLAQAPAAPLLRLPVPPPGPNNKPETSLLRPPSLALGAPAVRAPAQGSAWPRWWVIALGAAAAAATATAVVVWTNGRCPGRGDLGCF